MTALNPFLLALGVTLMFDTSYTAMAVMTVIFYLVRFIKESE